VVARSRRNWQEGTNKGGGVHWWLFGAAGEVDEQFGAALAGQAGDEGGAVLADEEVLGVFEG